MLNFFEACINNSIDSSKIKGAMLVELNGKLSYAISENGFSNSKECKLITLDGDRLENNLNFKILCPLDIR